jgi:hypothetical protein
LLFRSVFFWAICLIDGDIVFGKRFDVFALILSFNYLDNRRLFLEDFVALFGHRFGKEAFIKIHKRHSRRRNKHMILHKVVN